MLDPRGECQPKLPPRRVSNGPPDEHMRGRFVLRVADQNQSGFTTLSRGGNPLRGWKYSDYFSINYIPLNVTFQSCDTEERDI